MAVWKTLLIIYRELDVRLSRGRWRKRRFRHVATREQIIDATESFHALPRLVAELTAGAAQVEGKIVEVGPALRSLTEEAGGFFWPSPDDTRREVDKLAPAGSYGSIFIFLTQSDFQNRTSIRCRGWGLGIAASDWSNGATYAVVGMRLLGHGTGKRRAKSGCTNGFMVFAIISQNRGTPCLRQMPTVPKSMGTSVHKRRVGPIITAIF